MEKYAPVVLIIEDSETQAQQVAAYLSSYNIDVIIASDGPQGLRLVQAQHPDLIVLDINLPTMDGYQVCRRIKRDPETNDIPIIMLTSAAESKDMMKGIDAGAIDYIPKDQFAIDHLIATMKNMAMIPSGGG
ncbi:MAG: response regulator [Anaerolineae bacterium]|nr:response regulator [Anaerolineae bacterium]